MSESKRGKSYAGRRSRKEFDPRDFLKPSGGRRATEEERLAVYVIRDFYRKGQIKAEMIPFLKDYFDHRVEVMRDSPPEYLTGTRLGESIVESTRAIRSTIYYKYDNNAVLLSSITGNVLSTDVLPVATLASTTAVNTGLAIEIIAELLFIISSLVIRLPDNAEKAAQDVAKTVANNSTVKRLLGELVDLLKNWGKRNAGETAGDALKRCREALRKILSDLGQNLLDAFKEFFSKIFSNWSWWDIAKTVFDLLLMFTPIGWLKKYGVLIAGLLSMTGSIIAKM